MNNLKTLLALSIAASTLVGCGSGGSSEAPTTAHVPEGKESVSIAHVNSMVEHTEEAMRQEETKQVTGKYGPAITGVSLHGESKEVTGVSLHGISKTTTGVLLHGETKTLNGVSLHGKTQSITGVSLHGETETITSEALPITISNALVPGYTPAEDAPLTKSVWQLEDADDGYQMVIEAQGVKENLNLKITGFRMNNDQEFLKGSINYQFENGGATVNTVNFDAGADGTRNVGGFKFLGHFIGGASMASHAVGSFYRNKYNPGRLDNNCSGGVSFGSVKTWDDLQNRASNANISTRAKMGDGKCIITGYERLQSGNKQINSDYTMTLTKDGIQSVVVKGYNKTYTFTVKPA
ncbi:hypothetical protein [Vibrio comitans]